MGRPHQVFSTHAAAFTALEATQQLQTGGGSSGELPAFLVLSGAVGGG